MKRKISYLLSHPIQYFSPLFSEMAAANEIDLTVYYCCNPAKSVQFDKGFGQIISWDIPLLEGYKFCFLKNLSNGILSKSGFWSLININIAQKLYADKNEVLIVHGWGYFTHVFAIIINKLLGKQVWLRGENPCNQERKKPKWVRTIKKLIFKYGLFKLVDRFLYIGTENKEFYRYYGVPVQKLIYAPYAVNNKFFSECINFFPGKNALRKELNLPLDAIIILFSGKYIRKKNPMDLLKAYTQLDTPKRKAMIMMGDGALRQEMEQFINDNKLVDVVLTGFINQTNIAKYYMISDIFVLPSGLGETWGLVLNEAMIFGLPAVVSSTVGSSADLIKHGENGYVFKEGDIDELIKNLSMLIENDEFRTQAGRQSKEIIKEFSYSVMIENILEHLKNYK